MAIGIVIICDRCDAQKTMRERDVWKYTHSDARMRWQHLCEKCTKEYQELETSIGAFRNKEESKFYQDPR